MIDFYILEQFITFYHTGTLCDTAKKLHISQSTLTRSMQKLESEFAVPLFKRTKNSISFTETGQLAAEKVILFLKQYKTMLYQVRDFDRKNHTISIGSCAPFPLTELIRQISISYPDASISSELKTVSALYSGLNDDTYQLIVLPYCPDDDRYSFHILCKENLFFLLPKKHRYAKRKSLAISEMDGENILLFQHIGFWYDLVKEKMPNSKFLMQTDFYVFQELIANSNIPIFATDVYKNDKPDSDRVCIPIADPDFHVDYYMICKKENTDCFCTLFQNY